MQNLSEFFDRAKDYHILVAGDMMLDRYLWGRVDRISPEAPVPVLQLQSSESRLGGAANVALNLRRLGAGVSMMGMAGNDTAGDELMRMLSSEGIHSELIQRNGDVPTTVKTRVLGGHQHLLRIDEEVHRNTIEADVFDFQGKLDALMRDSLPDAIVLQDYNKGFLSPPMIDRLLNFAEAREISVCVDPKDENFFAYQGVAVFKPNLRELRAKMPFAVDVNEASLTKAADHLREKLKCGTIAITLSEHGIFLSSNGESGLFPTRARTVLDVCGAGDAVIAVLALGYLMDASPEQMATLANAAGGVVCGTVGVSPVEVEAMRREIGS